MAPQNLSSLSPLRRQHLLVEYSGLKYASPYGVFVSLTPGDPTLWSGVIFVRKGPYAPSILRFQISFPPSYPALPPLVTFLTDMFHPLITPLTTYMYTTDISDSGTVSATDEERLPPGGFSLRHGFPGWFGRTSRRSTDRVNSGSLLTPPRASSGMNNPSSRGSGSPTPRMNTGDSGSTGSDTGRTDISTHEVLRYIRSTFDDEGVMDAIPLEAAGNPGAWHAWRTHQMKQGKIVPVTEGSGSTANNGADQTSPQKSSKNTVPIISKKPGEWNWDGVWEVRVKRGVDASVAEVVLFGASAGDDLIRFLNMDEDRVEGIMEDMKKSLETIEPHRRGVV